MYTCIYVDIHTFVYTCVYDGLRSEAVGVDKLGSDSSSAPIPIEQVILALSLSFFNKMGLNIYVLIIIC